MTAVTGLLSGALLHGALRVPLMLDVNALVKGGWIAPGLKYVWAWGSPLIASVYVTTSESCLSLFYRHGDESLPRSECLVLERAECYFGGTRPRLVCTACDKGYYRLFLQEGLFRCRACHRLRHSKDTLSLEERAALVIEQVGSVVSELPEKAPVLAPVWASVSSAEQEAVSCGSTESARIFPVAIAGDPSERNPSFRGSNGRPMIPILSKPCTCGSGDALKGHRLSCPRGRLIYWRLRLGKPLF